MRSGSSIRIDVSKQTITYADERLVFPRVTPHWTLSHLGFAVDQHSPTTLFDVAPSLFESSEWRGQDENQKYKGHGKTRCRDPVTPIKQVNDRENWERLDRRRNRNQSTGEDLLPSAQRHECGQHQRKQNQAWLAEVIARPDVHDHEQIWNQIQPHLLRAFHSAGENGTEPRAAQPGGAIDRHEEKNEPALAK